MANYSLDVANNDGEVVGQVPVFVGMKVAWGFRGLDATITDISPNGITKLIHGQNRSSTTRPEHLSDLYVKKPYYDDLRRRHHPKYPPIQKVKGV